MQDSPPLLALIVETNALVALLIEDVLVSEGFQTVLAFSEEEALTKAEAADRFAVAVLELRLGRDLAGCRIIRALREQRPSMPVVVYTGYDHNAPEANLRGLGGPTERLTKLGNHHELAAAVWEVIDRGRTGRLPNRGRRTTDETA
jgi:ActR/RegA family two-component response regulator